MSTSKETMNKEAMNKEQQNEAQMELCQAKLMNPMLKRKIVAEVISPIKICKVVEKKVSNPECCFFCNKKLKFINTFKCRCEMYFCNKHRFYDQHACDFDYKSEAKQKLKENNPKIVAKKISD